MTDCWPFKLIDPLTINNCTNTNSSESVDLSFKMNSGHSDYEVNCKEDSIPDSEQPVEKAKEPSVAALRLQKVYVRLTRMPLAEILRMTGEGMKDGIDNDNSLSQETVIEESDERNGIGNDSVWSESPCIDSDVDESDFLGFRMNGERKKEEQAMRKDKPARKRKRRRKYKRANTTHIAQPPPPTTTTTTPKKKHSTSQMSSNSPKVKKKWEHDDRSPYKRGYNGWEDCLRPRPAQVQHYQSTIIMKKRLAEKEFNEMLFKRAKRSKDETHESSQDAQIKEPNIGDIMWCKFGAKRSWPAIIVRGEDLGAPQPIRSGQAWVFWFGDRKISEISHDRLADFVTHFNEKYSPNMGSKYKNSVKEAIHECSVRANVHLEDDIFSLYLEWAKAGFQNDSNKDDPFAPDPENPIPAKIKACLEEIKTKTLEDLNSLETSADSELEVQPVHHNSIVQNGKDSTNDCVTRIRNGHLRIQDICIVCLEENAKLVAEHPLFEGGLCGSCRGKLIETVYAYGDDGTNVYCAMCCGGGDLLICDKCDRVYCISCINKFVGPAAVEKFLKASPWYCYLCYDHPSNECGLIKGKKDYQINVFHLFHPPQYDNEESISDIDVTRPIRVLSLFDGISTGRLCLDAIGIEIDKYFASEIEQDSINVSNIHHSDNIIQLGPVEELTTSKIKKLLPIDLVIGGSPCNDLSLVNPARKGLFDPSGTGKLFFDFYRIMMTVKLHNKRRPVYWMYENVASMPQEYRDIITRFLGREPVVIDSKYFSAQNRARYFWGNIPGLQSPLSTHVLKSVSLDSVLTKGCNRIALVDKVRTVTTRSNSLKQKKNCVYPVAMNGVGDVLWVTELEMVFGFPKHYTDVGNLSVYRRQQLLGKAWSVPVIKHIFMPLRKLFASRPLQKEL